LSRNKAFARRLSWREHLKGRRAVFLVRYFFYAGSALLALLLISNWYWPAPAVVTTDDQAQQTSMDKAILRIRSAQKWPKRIVFDTNIPTIVPPPTIVAKAPSPPPPFKTAEALNNSELTAHAEAKPEEAKAPARKVAAARHRIYRPATPQFGTYPVASAWSPWW
jgi:hypothetical protein